MTADHDMLVHAILGRGLVGFSHRMLEEMTKRGFTRFVGNQHNENWEWDAEALRKLDDATLESLYTALTAKV
mgnify:FL=1